MIELPKIKMGKKTYYLDPILKQLRNVENPHDYMDMNDGFIVAIKLNKKIKS